MSEIFLFAEECSFANIESANLLISRIDPVNVVAAAARAVRNEALFVDFGRHAGEHRNFSPQVVEIVARQPDLRAGFGAAGLKRSMPRKNANKVPAKSAKRNHESIFKSGSIGQ